MSTAISAEGLPGLSDFPMSRFPDVPIFQSLVHAWNKLAAAARRPIA